MSYFTHWEPQLDWGEQFFVMMFAFPLIIAVVAFLVFWASRSHLRDKRLQGTAVHPASKRRAAPRDRNRAVS